MCLQTKLVPFIGPAPIAITENATEVDCYTKCIWIVKWVTSVNSRAFRCRDVLWLQHQFGIHACDGIMARAAVAADEGETLIPEWVLDVPEVTDAQVIACLVFIMMGGHYCCLGMAVVLLSLLRNISFYQPQPTLSLYISSEVGKRGNIDVGVARYTSACGLNCA